ncbi:PREDICTED: cytochrome P450 82G1-like isoform X2 [Lupinus angustifolius]|uniref:cytochrome P450 82G1-like isoform X2 n=1 Tax=Lupinus angustifolius TaxID=3871 RepID=UPI00092EC4C4|nr:PREDICTED: cytochrome P450 82G1-like isoform X2 [Lupinus angustifolius]
MDTYFQTILSCLLVLFIAWRMFRSIRSQNKGSIKCNKVPQPNGALPIIGHLHFLNPQEPYFRTFSTMAQKYGSIFSLRLGCHNTLVVSSREIAKEILKTNDKVFASRPNISVGRYIGYNNAILALAPYGQYWREMRKMATLELLSCHRLEKLKHVRDLEIFSLIKELNDSIIHQVPINLSNLLEHLTFNIIVRMIGGKRFRGETISQEDSDAWRLKKAIKDATYLSGVFVVGDAIPYLSWFDFQGHVSFMKKTFKEMDLILQKWMDEHIRKRDEENESDGRCENDFMDVLISTFQDQDVICGHKREIVIKATSMILILTGSGSTSMTLTWALSLLLNHPNVLKAVKKELDINIGKHKWVQECDIKDLKYLQAIIKETLRLYPPAPLTGIREATEECYVSKYYIPKGTRLLINLWKLHRDPEIWCNPNEFQPERFLTTTTTHANIDFQSQDFEFIPFSFGRRSCPGMTLGLQVVHLTLARLIQGFDICTKDGVKVDMSEGLGLALPKEKALEVMLKPLLPLELYESL